MKQHTFKLSDSGKEFPARFGGQLVTYSAPDTWEEIQAAVPAALPEGITRDAVLAHKCKTQSIDLDVQKGIKAFLGREKDGVNIHKDRAVAEVIAEAVAANQPYWLPVPGVAREGTARTSKKVAEAEARTARAEKTADAAKVLLLANYATMPKNLRKNMRQQILDAGVLDAADLDKIDAA